ncbi:MAG: hypothetical protein AUG49_20970 [Catenulispora sp. 13_1_20CM_3_70_7]|nr:MAG: hypothetical protein AUG49_20970 [Catenulispora sp. 13_1_20CM_3_70_7]
MSQNTHQTGLQMIPPEDPDTERRPGMTGERPWWRKYYPWYAVLGGTVLFNLLWAFPHYLSTDPNDSRSQLDPNFHPHFGFLIAHVATGNLALVTMMLQIWPHLRRNHPAVHRWVGRVYVFGAVIPTTLIVLFVLIPHRANDGSTGLACGGLALFTTYGRIIFWMILHWGLQVNTEILVEGTSWGAWIVNLLAAQWYLEYSARRRGKNLPAGRFSPATGAIRQ